MLSSCVLINFINFVFSYYLFFVFFCDVFFCFCGLFVSHICVSRLRVFVAFPCLGYIVMISSATYNIIKIFVLRMCRVYASENGQSLGVLVFVMHIVCTVLCTFTFFQVLRDGIASWHLPFFWQIMLFFSLHIYS